MQYVAANARSSWCWAKEITTTASRICWHRQNDLWVCVVCLVAGRNASEWSLRVLLFPIPHWRMRLLPLCRNRILGFSFFAFVVLQVYRLKSVFSALFATQIFKSAQYTSWMVRPVFDVALKMLLFLSQIYVSLSHFLPFPLRFF